MVITSGDSSTLRWAVPCVVGGRGGEVAKGHEVTDDKCPQALLD